MDTQPRYSTCLPLGPNAYIAGSYFISNIINVYMKMYGFSNKLPQVFPCSRCRTPVQISSRRSLATSGGHVPRVSLIHSNSNFTNFRKEVSDGLISVPATNIGHRTNFRNWRPLGDVRVDTSTRSLTRHWIAAVFCLTNVDDGVSVEFGA